MKKNDNQMISEPMQMQKININDIDINNFIQSNI